MEQPDGFKTNDRNKVYKLNRALYGLKQASLAWNIQAHNSITKLGFRRLYADTGIYVKRTENDIIVIILYVDDIIFMGNNEKTVNDHKKKFMDKWESRDLGDLSEYLGMNIVIDKQNHIVTIDQAKYAKKIVERFGLINAKPVNTPLPAGYVPNKQIEGQATQEMITYYQQLIGSLLFLAMCTRLDIVYATILMSQFVSNPSQDHIKKALHIIQYVGSTLDYCIKYNGKDKYGLICYADADWASNPIDRKSTTGIVVKLAGAPVYWKSAKQKTIALSSTEAEYMAASDACRQISWLKNLFEELGYNIRSIPLIMDNQAAIYMASNPAQEQRTKHMDVRYHYIRSCVKDDLVDLYYIKTEDQAADILTKNLLLNKHSRMLKLCGIHI